jgi:site-specific DNA recombinase
MGEHTTKRKAFLYCRVSDPTKGSRTDPLASIPRQRDELTRMAQEDGVRIVEVFEEAQTAHAAGRHAFDRMMARIVEVDAVYVVAYDRLTRIPDPSEQEKVRKAFVAAGTDIVTPGTIWRYSDPDFDTPETRLNQRVQGLFAAHEWETITRRLRKGKLRHVELGKYYGQPPAYGYAFHHDPQTGKKVFTVDEAQATVVRRVFDLYLQGEGQNAIAQALNAQGIPSPKGLRWSQAQIARMLRQEAYAGLSGYRKHRKGGAKRTDTILVESVDLPAILPREVWERAQQAVAVRARHHRHGYNQHPLSGILRCPGCHKTMVSHGNWSGSRLPAYYACRSLRKEFECPDRQMYRMEEAHRAVIAWLRREIPRYVRGEHTVAPSALAPSEEDKARLLSLAQKRLDEVNRQWNGILKLMALETITEAEGAEQLDRLRDERAQAQAQLEEAQRQAEAQADRTHQREAIKAIEPLLDRLKPGMEGLREFFEAMLLQVYLKKRGKAKDNKTIILAVRKAQIATEEWINGGSLSTV